MSATFKCQVSTYQQFVPRGDDGWRRTTQEFSANHTAVVVMHAWAPPPPDQLLGWHRAVPYMRDATEVLPQVFPSLLTAVRDQGLPVFHVTGCGPDATPAEPAVPTDPTWESLHEFCQNHVFPGAANLTDISTGRETRHIAPEAAALPGEGTAETPAALHELCQARGINHLIYIGFAINWCLLMSPGGMVDMKRYGYLCSTIAEAVVAVENEVTEPHRIDYHQALWRVAVEFGFVFHHREFIAALSNSKTVI